MRGLAATVHIFSLGGKATLICSNLPGCAAVFFISKIAEAKNFICEKYELIGQRLDVSDTGSPQNEVEKNVDIPVHICRDLRDSWGCFNLCPRRAPSPRPLKKKKINFQNNGVEIVSKKKNHPKRSTCAQNRTQKNLPKWHHWIVLKMKLSRCHRIYLALMSLVSWTLSHLTGIRGWFSWASQRTSRNGRTRNPRCHRLDKG